MEPVPPQGSAITEKFVEVLLVRQTKFVATTTARLQPSVMADVIPQSSVITDKNVAPEHVWILELVSVEPIQLFAICHSSNVVQTHKLARLLAKPHCV